MNGCICVECKHQCNEYFNNGVSDKSYYEWTRKEDKCMVESEDKE